MKARQQSSSTGSVPDCSVRSGRRAAERPPAGVGRPVRVRTSSELGSGEVIAGSAVVALNAWAAAWPSFGRRLVTWSSYIVLTEPIPDRLEELGWTGGEGVADGRFTLHYLRTTPDGRIALGGGGGRAGFGGRIGTTFTDDVVSVERAAAGLRRLFPTLRDVRIEDAWGGPIDITSDHLPVFASLRGRPIHYGHGYSGNGVAPSLLGGRILAALALERADDPVLALPLVGVVPRAFPPEPMRYLGARVVREAVVRTELAEERGERPSRVLRAVSRVPRKLGHHLGARIRPSGDESAVPRGTGRRESPESSKISFPPPAFACCRPEPCRSPREQSPSGQAHDDGRALQARDRRVQAPGPNDHLHLWLARQLGDARPRRVGVDGPPLRSPRQKAVAERLGGASVRCPLRRRSRTLKCARSLAWRAPSAALAQPLGSGL